jgi:hypothetical protein
MLHDHGLIRDMHWNTFGHLSLTMDGLTIQQQMHMHNHKNGMAASITRMLTSGSHQHAAELLTKADKGPHPPEACSKTAKSFNENILPAQRRQRKRSENHARPEFSRTSIHPTTPSSYHLFLFRLLKTHSSGQTHQTDSVSSFSSLYSIISGVQQANPENLASNTKVRQRHSFSHFIYFCLIFLAFLFFSFCLLVSLLFFRREFLFSPVTRSTRRLEALGKGKA